MALKGFDKKWKDFPDYIIGITREIWEERGVGKLNDYYGKNILVRSPMGITRGNQAVIDSTLATLDEFPDRELFAEDVIWCGDPKRALLSSHRIVTTATHARNGSFGKATGKKFKVRVIADCAAKNNVIFDEWLVRDYGGIVRQLGMTPKQYAKKLVKKEGGAKKCAKPLTPKSDVKGPYKGKGNDNVWGKKYAEILNGLMEKNFHLIEQVYDRAVLGHYAGAVDAVSYGGVRKFWTGLRAAFPDAEFKINHQIGMDGDMMPPRAAVRWEMNGIHKGWGAFGKPTGAKVHVMGIAHAEFGPFGAHGATVRREYCLYDEIAVWKQILIHQGERK